MFLPPPKKEKSDSVVTYLHYIARRRQAQMLYGNGIKVKDIELESRCSQYLSLCYVVDCVSAPLHITFKVDSGKANNVANPDCSFSIRALAETIALLSDKKVVLQKATEEEKKGFNAVTKSVVDVPKLLSLVWNAKTTIMEGLANRL